MNHTPYGPYEKYVKRPLDCFCGLAAIIVFWWLYLIIAVLVRIKLGSPVLFTQERPGKDEKIFKLYKFRTMTNERDENGVLLPDARRLTQFGRLLRATSLDELPEAFNIIKGDMSVIGPRPQLVRDMVFMTQEQRYRHTVKPGLSGLAQVCGRNAISWENRIAKDLEYIQKISFWNDFRIMLLTVRNCIKQEDITTEGFETTEDLGDYLLRCGQITPEEYRKGMIEADNLCTTGR